MNEKDAIEIIIRAFEDARGSILFRDEIQAVNYLEDYVKNSVSKDKIREFIEKNRKEFGSRYNLLDYDDITYEYWIKADKLIKLLEEGQNENN